MTAKGLMMSPNEQYVSSSAKPTSKIIPNYVDIYIISSEEDSEYSRLLSELIISHNQSLIVKISSEESNSARLTILENARLIIPLLSSSFMKSTELVHELNIAWCRQRYASNFCFLTIVLERLPDKPTYVHLFPCFFDCTDKRWKEPHDEVEERSSSYKDDRIATSKAPRETLRCLATAVELFLGWMAGNDCPVIGLHDKFINYIHLTTSVRRFRENSLSGDEKQREKNVGSAASPITLSVE